jgi:hypothetical protein
VSKLQGKFAVEIINEAMGGNADFVDAFDLDEDITGQKVKEVLRRARIRFAPVLLHDIKTVFEDEEEPRYFVSHGRISDRYRKKYGVRDSQIDQFTSPYGRFFLFDGRVAGSSEDSACNGSIYLPRLPLQRQSAPCPS